MLNQSAKLSKHELGKIRFLCRRGLKELDIILPKFIDKYLLSLSKKEIEVFIEMLEYDDHKLLASILTPPKKQIEAFISVCLKLKNCGI